MGTLTVFKPLLMNGLNYFMNALKAVFVAFLTLSFNALALDKALQAQIQVVKNAFQQNDVEAISKLVAYPLNREHPIPAIKNEAEFIKRYKEVFDDALINLIINSDTEKTGVRWGGEASCCHMALFGLMLQGLYQL
jgi:hypothetical protein